MNITYSIYSVYNFFYCLFSYGRIKYDYFKKICLQLNIVFKNFLVLKEYNQFCISEMFKKVYVFKILVSNMIYSHI